MERIDPQSDDFSLLKVHDSADIEGVSLCYGSVQFGDDYFFALYVIAPDGEVWLWDARNGVRDVSPSVEAEERALVLVKILSKRSHIDGTPDDLIPIDIAIAGKPMIAGYLYTISQLSKDEISDTMGVDRSTVTKYLNRIKPEMPEIDY